MARRVGVLLLALCAATACSPQRPDVAASRTVAPSPSPTTSAPPATRTPLQSCVQLAASVPETLRHRVESEPKYSDGSESSARLCTLHAAPDSRSRRFAVITVKRFYPDPYQGEPRGDRLREEAEDFITDGCGGSGEVTGERYQPTGFAWATACHTRFSNGDITVIAVVERDTVITVRLSATLRSGAPDEQFVRQSRDHALAVATGLRTAVTN
ncbi:MAG: hypothetical protein ACRDT4_00510 [Micromonosporaceae bacterium]